MKRTNRLLPTIVLVATVAFSIPSSSHAGKRDAFTSGRATAGGGPAATGWGAAAGWGCRYGIAHGGLVPGSPWFPFTGGICLLALLDALF